jgi:putative phage-type endonuclease
MTASLSEQRSEAWFEERLGKATASRFSDVLAKTKSGPSASRQNYLLQLVCERLTHKKQEDFSTPAMQWGIDNEPNAKAAYEYFQGRSVVETGFLVSPEHPWVGGSPDGLIGGEGLIEIKCPMTAAHITTVRHGMPSKHAPQVQGLLWISGRAWCDFVSFDPRLPPGLDLYVQRITRDDEYIQVLSTEILTFLDEVDSVWSDLRDRIHAA